MGLLLREPPLFFLSVAVVLFVSTLLGYRLASASTGANEDSHRHEHIASLRQGLFVLLGLLLGFTIAMVLPRFDQRRDLVTEEANAIGTTLLRTRVLPEPQRSTSKELLRQYVDVAAQRSFAEQILGNPLVLKHMIEQTDMLQDQLWEQAMQVTEQNQTAVVATYVQALNQMIDVSSKRLAVFESRVPGAVWIIILVVAVFPKFPNGIQPETQGMAVSGRHPSGGSSCYGADRRS